MARSRWASVTMLGFMAVTLAAYLPGLAGSFLFDDFVNLNLIGATGPVDDWSTFLRYVTSGTADPTGRPLALLTFLLDARDWPADPAPFLRTNVMLHLLNGALLYGLLRRLEQALRVVNEPPRDFVPVFAAGLWLLHPLFVSTTLYIVQREAMLPATFSLLGLWLYVDGRKCYREGLVLPGISRIVLGITGGTALSVLCKANGVLLPILAWVIESTAMARADSQCTNALGTPARLPLAVKFPLLIIPSLAIFAYLASKLSHANAVLPSRGWTITERLMTEPRVLVDYFGLLAVPRSMSAGLYNDGFQISTSILQPWTTLPAILVVLAALATGLLFRTKFPRAAAGVLFFLAGHLLESTVLPLELFFEHRNYLPALLLGWPLASALDRWRAAPIAKAATFAGIVLILACTTFLRADIWGRPADLAQAWARLAPESPRAQATAAMIVGQSGRHALAANTLRPIWRSRPTELQIAFNYIDASCQAGGVSSDDTAKLEFTLTRSPVGELLAYQWLSRAIDAAFIHQCSGITETAVERWIGAAAANPSFADSGARQQAIEPLLGQLSIRRGDPNAALLHFNHALLALPSPDFAARNVSQLASAGYYAQALKHLDLYDSIEKIKAKPAAGMPVLHALVLKRQNYWPKEMRVLREKLAKALATEANGESK